MGPSRRYLDYSCKIRNINCKYRYFAGIATKQIYKSLELVGQIRVCYEGVDLIDMNIAVYFFRFSLIQFSLQWLT